MLLGFPPSLRVAECTHCHMLTSPRFRECPRCKASFPQNFVIRKMQFQDAPDERVETFVSCPGCGRQLGSLINQCPECNAIIAREYASQNMLANANVSQAFVTAQKLDSQKPFALFILLASAGAAVYVYLFGPTLGWFLLIPFAGCILELLRIKQWFRWFGSVQSDNEDFVAAREKVKGALWRWLTVLAVQLGLTAWWFLWWLKVPINYGTQ